MKLVFVEILAILAMAYGDVSHIVPNANEINGLSGYQYDSSEDSLQYLPPSLPQQPHAFHQVPLELTNEAAASVVDNSNESLVSVAVDSGSSSISSSLLPLNNEADQQINERSNIETSEAESSNESQQSAVTPSPYLPPSLSQQPQASEELALELPVAAPSVAAEANAANAIETNDVAINGIDERISVAGSAQVSQQTSSSYLPPLLSSLLSSRAETNDVQQEVIPSSNALPVAVETPADVVAPQLPEAATTENSSGESALSSFAFECNKSGGNQLCQTTEAVQQESRASIVEAASADAQVSVPGSKYLPALEDAPVPSAAVEVADYQLPTLNSEQLAQDDISRTQSMDTQIFEIQSQSSALAAKVPLELTTTDKILSRQYLTPLLSSSQTEQAENSVAVETKVVQPSHTFTKNEGYKYQTPANSFEF